MELSSILFLHRIIQYFEEEKKQNTTKVFFHFLQVDQILNLWTDRVDFQIVECRSHFFFLDVGWIF